MVTNSDPGEETFHMVPLTDYIYPCSVPSLDFPKGACVCVCGIRETIDFDSFLRKKRPIEKKKKKH